MAKKNNMYSNVFIIIILLYGNCNINSMDTVYRFQFLVIVVNRQQIERKQQISEEPD